MRSTRILVLVFALLLAGCTSADPGPNPGAETPDGSAPGATNRTAPNDGEDCSETILVAPISFDHANGLLPDGFTAADIGGAFGLPVEGGRAGAFIFVVRCETHGWGDGLLTLGGVSIAVEDPGIDDVPSEAVAQFYVFQSTTENEALASFMDTIGWNVTRTPVTYTRQTVAALERGGGTVEGDAGYTLAVEAGAPSGLDGVYRSWQVTPKGLAHLDYVINDAPAWAGQITCTLGGLAAEVAAMSSCTDGAAMGLVFDGDWTGVFRLIPA